MQASVKADAYYKYITGPPVVCLLLDTENVSRKQKKQDDSAMLPFRYDDMRWETD